MSIDEQKLAADVTAELIKSTIGQSIKNAGHVIKSQWEKVFEDFAPYMKRMQSKNTHIRTILKKDGDVGLYEIYVPLIFKNSNK